MRRLGVDTRHFRNPTQLYTREMLEAAAAQSTSIVDVVRRLGAMEVGGPTFCRKKPSLGLGRPE